MAEVSTPVSTEPLSSLKSTNPRQSTIAFLRQFARCYVPMPHGGMVLN
ncbi:MAG: hypothetical protein K2L32_01570 [Muribaculaceae bacterium]|nr:hypothetical protein [Muribaculaceae bacterium]